MVDELNGRVRNPKESRAKQNEFLTVYGEKQKINEDEGNCKAKRH